MLLAFPLILLMAFSSFPKSSTPNDQDKEISPRALTDSSDHSEKSADLPHVPLVQHNHPKDLSLSEKAAVAVAGLVGPGAPTSVFDFSARTIGETNFPLFHIRLCDIVIQMVKIFNSRNFQTMFL